MATEDSKSRSKSYGYGSIGFRLHANKHLLKVALPIAIFFLIVLVLFSVLKSGESLSASLTQFDQEIDRYLLWLKNHGTQVEISIFFSIAERLSDHVVSISYGHLSPTLLNIYLQLLGVVIRLAFVLIASVRAWILLFGAVLWYSTSHWKPYSKKDLLGVTGNGKVFFSGIHVELSDLTSDGVPRQLVPNLACPRTVSATEVKASSLGSILLKYDALSNTSIELASIILAHPSLPMFATAGDEMEKLFSFKDPGLISGATSVLQLVLDFHENISDPQANERPEAAPVIAEVNDLDQYTASCSYGLSAVVPLSMRRAIASIDKKSLAATVLALYAGKTLGYLREGNHWARRTSYPHLSARSVIHSCAAFSDEFSPSERDTIRKAIVYSMRFSVFGPIPLPPVLNEKCQALRQWTELLQLLPFELNVGILGLELFALTIEFWNRFEKQFIHQISEPASKVGEGSRVTSDGYLFVPVENLVSTLRNVISKDDRMRLERLTATIAQNQRTQEERSEPSQLSTFSQEELKGMLPRYQKVFEPLSARALHTLSEEVSCPVDVLKDWVIFRNIFLVRGWLARHIGHSSVPEHACCLTVFKGPGMFAKGELVGATGMVPLRGSFIQEKVGRNWDTYLARAEHAVIADTKDAFDKLCQGIDVYAASPEGGA